MSAHVLLNSLNELRIKCGACQAFYHFLYKFNIFNNTRALFNC